MLVRAAEHTADSNPTIEAVGGGTARGAARPARPGSDLRASVLASLVGKAAEMVTLVLLATVVPRLLGPADYGRFSVPLTVVTLGSLAMTLGGPTLMARFVPAALPEHRPALARALGLRLARGRAVQLAAVAAVAATATVQAPATFPPLVTALVVVALAVNVATSLALQVGLGLGRAGPWSARFPLQNAVLVVGVVGLHRLFGPTGAVAALVVSALAPAVLAAVVVGPLVRAGLPDVPVPAGAIRFGVLNAAGAALVQCAHRGGVVAVAVLAGSAVETGYAALAVGIALGATYAVLQAFTVALPHLAAPPAAGPAAGTGVAAGAVPPGVPSDPVAEGVLRHLALGLVAVLVPGCLLAAALLDPLVPAAFGPRFHDAAAAFGPALALVVLAPLHALTVQVAALRLRAEVALAGGVATAVAFVLGAVALVPSLGAAGATGAALAGVVAGTSVAVRGLPGAGGGRLVGASYAGAALVLAVAALA